MANRENITMLQAINDRIKGWLGIVIVVLIGLPFALWGIQSYFDDAGPRYAAKVNNIEISANEFERTVSMQRQALLRQYGNELPIQEKDLRERTLQQLINQRLLESVTFESGYRISDATLAARIQQQFTVDGVFDRMRFEAMVASLGMSIPMYEQTLRNELRLQQMQLAIANSTFVTREEIKNIAVLNEQTRDISVLTFNVDYYSTEIKPTTEEIKQYYEMNRHRFMLPEKIKIDYVEILSSSLADSVEVDEVQIIQMYDDYVLSIARREERKARHILLQVAEDETVVFAKIKSLKLDLEQGADFTELAKTHSQDTGSAEDGGDLGWVTSGDMVKPFEDVLFEMKKGTVSEIIETQFGYHLIMLDDVRSEAVSSFEDKRKEFEAELKKDGVASLFYDLSERLASIAYENPDDLGTVVDELSLVVNSSDYFTRDKGQGLLLHEKIRNISLSSLVLEQGSNSDIIEISPTHVVVLRLNEHVPATAIPIENVSSKIENILKVQNAHERTKTAAAIIKTKIEAGESIEDFEGNGISMDTITSVSRNDGAKVSDPVIVYSAFEMVPDTNGLISVKQVDLLIGDVALVVLNNINTSDDIAQDKLDLVKAEIVREYAIRDFSSALLAIKEHADIEKNTRIIER